MKLRNILAILWLCQDAISDRAQLVLQSGSGGSRRGRDPADPVSPHLSLNTIFMDAVRKPLFLLDLGSLPREGPLADWLAKGKPAWNHRFEGNPALAFDALVVIDTISPLRLLK